jgi:calcineurin-like phosphoesterase
MDKNNSLNKFLKKESKKHFPATGIASLCGVIVEASEETGLANNIEYFVHGGVLKYSD